MPGDGFSASSPSTLSEQLQSPPSSAASPSALSFEPPLRPAGSRVITPAPLSIVQTASPVTTQYASPSPVGGGPCTNTYVIPPRPRPGRKPATDEPASKRKAQNRESQRAFRARKAQKLHEMQEQVMTAEQKHHQEMAAKNIELDDCMRTVEQLRIALQQQQDREKALTQERDYWKTQSSDIQRKVDDLTKQLIEREQSGWGDRRPVSGSQDNSHNRDNAMDFQPSVQVFDDPIALGCGKCKPDQCACIDEITRIPTSPVLPAVPLKRRSPTRPNTSSQVRPNPTSADDFADREVDFTQQFMSKRSDNRPSIGFMTQDSPVGDLDARCGFCTDDTNCVCRADALRSMEEQSRPTDLPTPPRDWNDIGAGASPKRAASGPGTCEDCMANPRQRAWCQRVAQLRNETNPPLRRVSASGGVDPADTRSEAESDRTESHRRTIGCSDTFKLLDGRVPMDSDNMDWVSSLQPIEPSDATMRQYSALEIDTASIIATLQQSTTPHKSNERNYEMRAAPQQQRQMSSGPLTPGSSSSSSECEQRGTKRTLSGSPRLPISSIINRSNRSPNSGYR